MENITSCETEINDEKLIVLIKELPQFEYDEDNEDDWNIGTTMIVSDLLRYSRLKIKENNNSTLKKIGNLLNICWKNGTYAVRNAIMVSYFEHLSDDEINRITPYLSTELIRDSKEYLIAWKEFLKEGKEAREKKN